jgi:hypothetical protein
LSVTYLPFLLLFLLLQIVLNTLITLTCDGEAVSSIYGCVKDGVLCGDAGTCTDNACVCNSGYEGEFCEDLVSTSSSSNIALAVALGTHTPHHTSFHTPVLMSFLPLLSLGVIIPVVVLLFLLLALFLCCLLFFVRKSRVADDWSINFEELELMGILGAGGYGEVCVDLPSYP